MLLPALQGWDSFYVIIGSSAAALTGLMFVVIALLPATSRPRDANALDAFATPTIVHFCAVLLIGALIEIPRHSLVSLGACLVIAGAVGLTYAILVVRRTVRQQSYSPELEDWIWHCILPVIAYLSLFIASLFIVKAADRALVAVGASALLLLFVGIHNAWDAAVWMTTAEQTMQEDEKKIRELIDQWLRSTKEGDLQTILTLMADDVLFLTPGNPPMNKTVFAETFKSFAGKVKLDAKQEIKELRVSSALAYCWSHMTLTMEGKTRTGHILSVFRKHAGKWVLSRDANFVT